MKIIKRVTANIIILMFLFQLFPTNVFNLQLVARAEADTEAPAKPEHLAIILIDTTNTSIDWDAATDNEGVENYNIYKDNVLIDSTSGLSYTVGELSPNTVYTFSVTAEDAAGNESDAVYIEAVTAQDTEAPSIVAGLTALSVTASSISFVWTASTDNVCVAKYKIYNGSTLVDETANPFYTVSGLSANTEYTFGVAAEDASGNSSAVSTLTVTTKDTSAEDEAQDDLDEPADEEDTEAPTAPAALTLTGKTDTSAACSWTAATDNTGVTGYNVYSGEEVVGTTADTAYTVTGLVDKTQYTFHVKACDVAGNLSPASDSLTVTTSIGVPTGVVGSAASTAITVSWSAVYGMSSYELMLDGTLISDINATSYVCGGLSTGKTYAMKVRAKSSTNTGDWSSEIRVTTGTGTNVSGTVSADTTWTAANSPYMVTSDLTVGPGVTLTIEAGTIVKFRSITQRLTVNGMLNVVGSNSSPVVFTSIYDTLYGGTPASYWRDAYWGGIVVSNTGTATIDHAIIRYAGWYKNDYPGISAKGKLTLTNSDIMNSVGTGIYINSVSDVTIDNNIITNTEKGIYIGQYSTGALTIENNTISDSTSYSIQIVLTNFNPASFTGYDHNIFNDPQFFTSGSLNVDLTLNGNTNLVIDNKITIPQGKTLTVQAGAVISTYINGITVNGILNSLGNISDKVVFKGSTSTLGERWSGIYVGSTGELNMDYTLITEADMKFNGYGIYCDGKLSITNSQIIHAEKCCIFVNTDIQPNIKYNSFINTNNGASDNRYGIYNNKPDTITVDASYNYWGSSAGPGKYVWSWGGLGWHWTTDGSGVTDGVAYIPYFGDDLNSQHRFGQNNAPSGSFYRQYTDMTMSNSQQTFAVIRTYNSLDDRADTLFGRGWTFGFEGSVSDYVAKITDENGNTQSYPFHGLKVVRLTNGAVCTFTDNGDGTFSAKDSRNTLAKVDGKYVLTAKDQTSYGFNEQNLLSWIKDKNGNLTTIYYDGNGKITSITDCTGRSYAVSYNGNHISSITDSLTGRQVTYVYDGGKLAEVIDPSGASTFYTYDSEGYLTGVYDDSNNLVDGITYYHTAENGDKVSRKTDAYGNTSTYTYDYNQRIVTITDANGHTAQQYYDSKLNVTREVDAAGKSSYVSYSEDDKYNEANSTTDRNGNKTSYTRDGSGNVTKITNPDGSTVVMTYDSKNNVLSSADEDGKYTYYVYDEHGNVIEKAQPLNGTDVYAGNASGFAVTHYSYYTTADGAAMNGLLAAVTDPDGGVTTYIYDSHGNLAATTDAEGHTTSTTYNTDGWLMETSSPSGDMTRFEYDGNGRQVKKILDGGETYRTVYDSTGNVIKEISPNQYNSAYESGGSYTGDGGTSYTYYNSGKVHTETDAEGSTTAYTYDIYGNVLTQTMPNGAVYWYEYDVLNRPVRKFYTEPSGGTECLLQTFAYDILGSGLTQIRETTYFDAASSVTTAYVYDYKGREIKKINPDGTTTATVYNKNSTVKSTTDEAVNTTYYTYDGLNRLTGKWIPFNAGLYSYNGYTYDNSGRVTSETSGIDPVALHSYPNHTVAVLYSYNADGTLNCSVDSEGRKKVYEYDADGNPRKQEEFTGAGQSVVTEYIYNHMDKPVSMTLHVRNGDIYGNAYSSTTDIGLVTAYSYDANGNLISTTAPNGVVTAYEYDNLNRVTETATTGTDEHGASTEITISQAYTWDGKISTTVDANGATTTNEYDGRGNLLRQTDACGGVTAYYYDLAGRLIALVSPNSYAAQASLSEMNRTEYAYDTMGRVITETQIYYDTDTAQWISFVEKAYDYDNCGNVIKALDAAGYASGTGSTVYKKIDTGYGTAYTYNYLNLPLTQLDPVSKDNGLTSAKSYAYDALGRKASETDANGVITSYTYNSRGDVLSVAVQASSAAAGRTVKAYTYNDLGQRLSETDGNGNTVTYTYNALGKVSEVHYPGDSTIAQKTVYYQYDAVGNLVKSWDTADFMALYAYDSQGHKLSETSGKADGTQSIVQTWAYDKNGNVRFYTDGNGTVTSYTYDAANRLVLQAKSGQTTAYTYDLQGNRLTETNWRGNTYTFEYDPLNRLVKKTDPYQNVIEILNYDNASRQSSSCDALGHVTAFSYDKNGRLVSTTDPENNTTSKSYDNAGNISSETDANGNITQYAYDEFNRLTVVTNALNETTSYTYDLDGNLLTKTDGAGNVTTYEYNAVNLPVKEIADGGRTGSDGNYTYDWSKVRSFAYTTDRLPASSTDQNGNTTTYTYDIHGRKLSETCQGVTVSYTYDNNSNALTVTDSTGTTARTYDGLNRVTSKSVPGIGVVAYVYDITANMADGCYAETSQDPHGNVTQKVYDRANRLLEVIADGKTSAYTYYANGSVASVVYDDGSSEAYTYTDDNQLSTVVNKKADSTVIDSYSYTYDDGNNILEKTDSTGTTTYTYDELGRLKTEGKRGEVKSYTYDAAGNRLTDGLLNVRGTQATTYSYDRQNRLTGTVTMAGDVTAESVAYSYDANGNLLTKTVTPYEGGLPQDASVALTNTYDVFNQLITSVTEDGDTVTNAYNGEGLRVQKTVNGVTTNYRYEYSSVVAEYDADNNLTARNIYGLNLLMRVSSDTHYYMYNGHADVTALVNAETGAVDGTYYYDAFGKIVDETGSVDNSIRYAGYQYDTETGLYYLNARMYDPVTARFLQEDTYKGNPKDPLSLNLYTYCRNNPLKYVDPSGHSFWDSARSWVRTNIVDPVKTTAKNTIKSLGKSIEKGAKSVGKVLLSVADKGGKVIADTVSAGTGFIRNAIDSAADNKSYFKAAANQVVYGNYTDDVNLLGTASQIVTGILGVDLPGDIRDLTYDVTNWEWSWEHIGQTVLDGVALIPVIGAIKYTDEIGTVLKHSDEAATALKGGTDGKYLVGAYQDIKGVPGLDAHHVGQKSLMKDLVENYDPKTAPAINVPKVGHTISGPNGIVSRSTSEIDSARQLLARDIMELRRVYDDIPNSALKELIELNKKMYPEMRGK